VELTDWFAPEIKPVRSGRYLTQFFDAGWMYDWMVYWDNESQLWRTQEGGNSLMDQARTWRGQLEAK
jgi:hypothetical protein